jgi:hypothetical protein
MPARMRFQQSLVFLITLAGAATLTLSLAAGESRAPAFEFREVNYFHRWSNNEQHEFTPDKQEDLDHWTDMITVNGYPDVHDGDGLAATANAVLENYKSHRGKVVKTSSVPRSADGPTEHLIEVIFTRTGFVEVAFARFKLVDQKGYSFVYSHRFYGGRTEEQMNAWMGANSADTEKALMEWNSSLGLLDKTEG